MVGWCYPPKKDIRRIDCRSTSFRRKLCTIYNQLTLMTIIDWFQCIDSKSTSQRESRLRRIDGSFLSGIRLISLSGRHVVLCLKWLMHRVLEKPCSKLKLSLEQFQIGNRLLELNRYVCKIDWIAKILGNIACNALLVYKILRFYLFPCISREAEDTHTQSLLYWGSKPDQIALFRHIEPYLNVIGSSFS